MASEKIVPNPYRSTESPLISGLRFFSDMTTYSNDGNCVETEFSRLKPFNLEIKILLGRVTFLFYWPSTSCKFSERRIDGLMDHWKGRLMRPPRVNLRFNMNVFNRWWQNLSVEDKQLLIKKNSAVDNFIMKNTSICMVSDFSKLSSQKREITH